MIYHYNTNRPPESVEGALRQYFSGADCHLGTLGKRGRRTLRFVATRPRACLYTVVIERGATPTSFSIATADARLGQQADFCQMLKGLAARDGDGAPGFTS